MRGYIAAINSQSQTTVRVPLDQATIQGAINAAGVGGTVLVSDGTYAEHDITITNPVNVFSVNGRDKTTIDAKSAGRVVAVNSTSNGWVRIQGFTLTAGYAPRPLENCGVAWQAGLLEVSNCTIQNCTGSTIAAGNASGLVYWDNIRFIDCIVRNNSVENYGGLGGATVIRCVLYGNSGWNDTTVLLTCDSYNCTIYGNSGGHYGGGMRDGRAVNCIFWGGDDPQVWGSPLGVTYSIVHGGYDGVGNLTLDPLFVNAASGDFHLSPSSPAIDTGDPAPAYDDPDGSRADMGAFPFLHPMTSLIKAVKPSFSYLSLGTNYQLQVSGDLNTWTNQGAAFTATNASMVYPQYWDVDNWSQLFFRLQVAP